MRVRLRHDQLQRLLANSPLSQNHWALKLGFSRGHWSEIVNGRHPYPSARTRERILEVFGVAFDILFAIEDAAPAGDEIDFRLALSGRYSLLGELGQGGMGTVYLAMDRRQGRQVALKVVNPEAAGGIGIPELLKEIALVGRLQHPNILPLFESGEDAGYPWFVMPYVRGGSLRDLLRSSGGRLALADALPFIAGISAALDHAHGERILHCDVKPENVLLHGRHAWVVDFGIARKLHTEAEEWRPLRKELDFSAGTPAYVSPEQASGEQELDARSDVYSLGCVVYEILAGRPPFEGGTTREVVTRRFRAAAPDLRAWAPELPTAAADVIARAMAFDRSARPASAGVFAFALQQAAAGETRLAGLHRGLERSLGRARRRAGLQPSQPIGRFLAGAGKDLIYAFRSLRRTPTVTVAAIACLALGLGATTAIFSAVYTALLRPLPFFEPERLVSVFRTTPFFETGPFSPGTYLDLARAPRSLEGVAAARPSVSLMEGTGEPRRVTTYRASDNLFQVLGVPAVQGRVFRPGDGDGAAPETVLLGEELWRTHFGADPAVIGGTIRLDAEVHTVVGVVPAGFRLPHGGQSLASDVWTTLRFTPDEASQRRNNSIWLVGRLKPGIRVESADAELRTQMEGIIASSPELRGEQLRVVPLHRESTQSVRGPLLLLLGAVGFVLLIAVSNVASLLLARGVERRREVAVRTALGASPGVVIRRALLESAVLAGAGVVLGVALAGVGVKLIGVMAAARLPQLI
ncbi:MAG TPA: protein kinase, partial [Gemmatimonadales bacterium]